MTSRNTVLRAVLAGVSTGLRSQSAVAACTLTPAGPGRVDRILHRSGRTFGAVVPVIGESIADKLPRTPPRTEFPGLLVRLGFGAVAASVLASRRGESQVAAAAIGSAAAAAASVGGMRARSVLAARAGGDLPGALGEDVLALGLGLAAARLA